MKCFLSFWHRIAGGLSALAWSLSAAAAVPGPLPLMDCPADADAKVTVVSIDVVRKPIFDVPAGSATPGRRTDGVPTRIARLANRLHPLTQISTISEELLFTVGDTVPVDRLRESERRLRAKSYFGKVGLGVTACSGPTAVTVTTREVWTLKPRLALDNAGGEENFTIGLAELNLGGSGRFLSAGYTRNTDRDGVDFTFVDPNVGGRFQRLRIALAENDDGYFRQIAFDKPFESLDARRSYGIGGFTAEQQDRLYFRGDPFASHQRDARSVSASAGWSRGLRSGAARRISVGFAHDRNEFSPISGERFSGAADRVLNYPFIAFEEVQNDFFVTRHFNRLHRAEDVYLGRRIAASLGFSKSGADRIVFSAAWQDAHLLRGKDVLSGSVNVTGFWRTEDDRSENLRATAGMAYHWQQTARWQLRANASYTWTEHLTADQQLLLGGDNGLRGYPIRYQLGDRRALIQLEQRYITDWHPLQSVRVGFVGFADVGRAWFPGAPSSRGFGWLADAGVGVRLESTRTAATVLHIDVAAPLVDTARGNFGQDVRSARLLVTLRNSL